MTKIAAYFPKKRKLFVCSLKYVVPDNCPKENCPLVRVRVRVSFRVGGQFSSGAIALEPKYVNEKSGKTQKSCRGVIRTLSDIYDGVFQRKYNGRNCVLFSQKPCIIDVRRRCKFALSMYKVLKSICS